MRSGKECRRAESVIASLWVIFVLEDKNFKPLSKTCMEQTNYLSSFQPSAWSEFAEQYKVNGWGEVPDEFKLPEALKDLHKLMVPWGTSMQALPQYAKGTAESARTILARIPEKIKIMFEKHLAKTGNQFFEGIQLRQAFTEWAVLAVSAKIAEQRHEVYY